MLTGTELKVLEVIAERGGKTTASIVASKIGYSSDYARIICTGLGNADYLDLDRSGICELRGKGWQELERRGWRKEEKEKGKDTAKRGGPTPFRWQF